MEKQIILTNSEKKCLREQVTKMAKMLGGTVVFDGVASERNAIKEPTQAQRIKNYSELIASGSKYQKPKHLRK